MLSKVGKSKNINISFKIKIVNKKNLKLKCLIKDGHFGEG